MRRFFWALAVIALVGLVAPGARAGDKEIAEQIVQKLQQQKQAGQLKGFGVDLEVDQGIVWVKGQVANRDQQMLVLDIARFTPGVKQVVNDIQVAGETAAPSGDTSRRSATETAGVPSLPGRTQPMQSSAAAPNAALGSAAPQVPSLPGGTQQAASNHWQSTPAARNLQAELAQARAEEAARKQAEREQAEQVYMAQAQANQAKRDQLDRVRMAQLEAERQRQEASRQVWMEHYQQQVRPASAQEEMLSPGSEIVQASAEAYVEMPAPPGPPAQQSVLKASATRPVMVPQLPSAAGRQPTMGSAPVYRSAPPAYAQQAQYAQMSQQRGYAMPAAHAQAMQGAPMNYQPGYMPVGGGVSPARYDQPYMPGYAWPSYASYPNYAAVTYPQQYSAQAWPYIGPFHPYPQVPLGWRKVTLEWDDGWWFLDFRSK